MRVLIIGGTGLISTGITLQLLARGDDLTLLNRGSRPLPFEGPIRSLQADRRDFARFEALMAEEGLWDCVIDMVCYQPDEAESAVRAFRGRTKQYIFCSTVDVYTKPAARYPIREDADRRPKPSFPYAYAKGLCEETFWAAYARGDLPITVIRPAQTYGEGGRLVHTLGFETYFLDRIRRGMPIVVHGDGTGLWSVCHREDVARAFVGAVGNEHALGRAYTVAGQEWLTWNRYYEGLAEAMRVPCPRLVHIPTEVLGRWMPQKALWCVENFSYINIFDTTAAERDLGFRYTIPWVEGARRTIEWLAQNGQIERAEDYPFYDRLIEAWDGAMASLPSLEAPPEGNS